MRLSKAAKASKWPNKVSVHDKGKGDLGGRRDSCSLTFLTFIFRRRKVEFYPMTNPL